MKKLNCSGHGARYWADDTTGLKAWGISFFSHCASKLVLDCGVLRGLRVSSLSAVHESRLTPRISARHHPQGSRGACLPSSLLAGNRSALESSPSPATQCSTLHSPCMSVKSQSRKKSRSLRAAELCVMYAAFTSNAHAGLFLLTLQCVQGEHGGCRLRVLAQPFQARLLHRQGRHQPSERRARYAFLCSQIDVRALVSPCLVTAGIARDPIRPWTDQHACRLSPMQRKKWSCRCSPPSQARRRRGSSSSRYWDRFCL